MNNTTEVAAKLPVHKRDFTDDIKAFMTKFAAYKHMLGHDISLRKYMWDCFAAIVAMHIEEYTVPQYGDYPTDNLTSFSADDCLTNIGRYAARLKTNSRGEEETLSDLLKIAHYAGSAFLKMKGYEELFKPEETTEVEPEANEVTEDDRPNCNEETV